MSYRILDLFAGLGGWSQAFRDRGHEVETLDLDPNFNCTYTEDLRNWEPTSDYDIVLASPPCEAFTTMSISRNWDGPNRPKTKEALLGIELVERTIELVRQIQPRFFWMENPRAMMRKLPQLDIFLRQTVTYCQYSESYMKPTDLWGFWPSTWQPRAACSNGSPCHTSVPRGTKRGVQDRSLSSAQRALVPYELSLEICKAVEEGWDLPPRKKMVKLGW